MPKKIGCLIFAIGMLAGCATDRAQTQTEATVVGAAGGAGVGAGIGYGVGGKEGAEWGAIIGGTIGSVAGYFYGTHVANQKEKYANTEDYLDAVIVNAKKVNDDMKSYNTLLNEKIGQLDVETRLMIAEYNRRAIGKSILQKKVSILKSEISKADKNLNLINNEIEIQKNVLNKEKQSNDIASNDYRFDLMKEQIDDLERNKSELEQDIAKLASLKTRVAV